MRGFAKVLGESVLLLGLLAVVPLLVPTSARRPWDFETYWYAAFAVANGLDPYSNDQLARIAGRPLEMPFVYPPITAPLFMPLTVTSVWESRWIWLALGILGLLVLAQIWRRHLFPSLSPVPLCLAISFGFNASSMWSLKTGNVAILEQLILWLGLIAYIKGRQILSVGGIIAASTFKLLPASFLALLTLPGGDRKPAWKRVAASTLVLAGLVLLPIALGPTWARGYLRNLGDERPWGYVNPSALGLIDTLLDRHSGPLLSEPASSLLLWLAYVALVALISIRPIGRAWRERDPLLWVMTATPLFVLLHPRPMAYTYLLAVPAMFYLVSPVFRRVGGDWAVATVLAAQAFLIPGLGMNYENPWTSNLPFFLLLGMWSAYALSSAATRAEGPAASMRSGSRGVSIPGTLHPAPLALSARRPWQIAAVVLTAIGGSAWFLFAEHRVARQWGFSLDDSWIYATFARNLAEGQGYSFNPGETVGGATGPLYVFILAFLYIFTHQVIWPAKVLGLASLAASSLLVTEAMRRIDPGRAILPLLAGLLVALSPPLLWGAQSGMELPVYLLATCAGLYFYTRERWTLTAACWSMGVWLRPEGVFLALLALIARPRITLRNTFGPATVTAVILAFYALFNQVVGGEPLPRSVSVKASFGSSWLASEWSMWTQWMWLWGTSTRLDRVGPHLALMIPALVVGAVVSFRRWPILTAYLFGFPLTLALFGAPGGQHARYIAYIIPMGILLACVGFARFSERTRVRAQLGPLVALGLLCLTWQVYTARLLGIAHGWNVQNINEMQRFVAERVRKGASPGDTIAVNDVGAMGYFSGCYVVDLVGLISPKRSFPENLSFYKPKYLAIFPDWYASYGVRDPTIDNIVFYDADSTYKYSPVVGVGLTRNTIASRDVMVLFERLRPEEKGTVDVPVYWH